MSHLPLHGVQTKAQRLSSLAHEVSLAGGLNGWIYRLTETVQPLPEPLGGRNRSFPEPRVAPQAGEESSARPGQM